MLQGERQQITRFEVERVARVYRVNRDAYRALGVSDKTFLKLCRRYRVETPCERSRRRRREWSGIKRTKEIVGDTEW